MSDGLPIVSQYVSPCRLPQFEPNVRTTLAETNVETNRRKPSTRTAPSRLRGPMLHSGGAFFLFSAWYWSTPVPKLELIYTKLRPLDAAAGGGAARPAVKTAGAPVPSPGGAAHAASTAAITQTSAVRKAAMSGQFRAGRGRPLRTDR